MNPIFKWIVAQSTGRLKARTCPKCGHREPVRSDQQASAVRCSRCGTSLPPPRT